MSLIEWNDDLSVHIESIDLQHQKLVGLVNALYDAMVDGKMNSVLEKIFDDLQEYTYYHFNHEEKLMQTADYAEYKSHKHDHDQLTAKLMDLMTKFKAGEASISYEIMDFLRDWLVDHIMVQDKKYAPVMQQKKVG